MTNETKQSIKFKIRDTVGQVNTPLFISTEFVYDYINFYYIYWLLWGIKTHTKKVAATKIKFLALNIKFSAL